LYHVPPAELVRSSRLLPPQRRNQAESLLAVAIEQQARSPAESVDTFRAAASAFRDRDDVTGELVAIGHEGLVRWWASDFAGLASLIERVNTLAEAGSSSAIALRAIAFAAIAHLGGESAGVHQHLAGFDDQALASWLPVAQWLRSVAYRRDGDLDSARRALEDPALSTGDNKYQVELARLRIDWLDGRVDHVHGHLRTIALHYEDAAQRVLARDAILELACKTAFFGEIETTRDLLDRAYSITLADVPSLHDVLGLIAQTALAVAEGDELLAASLLADHAEAALEGPTSWYWRDRAAIALVYVLAPETRAGWSRKTLHPVHRPGVELAEALVAMRRNDLSCVASLAWPAVGVIRAHLPHDGRRSSLPVEVPQATLHPETSRTRSAPRPAPPCAPSRRRARTDRYRWPPSVCSQTCQPFHPSDYASVPSDRSNCDATTKSSATPSCVASVSANCFATS
jgi:hypothetical protein